MREENGTSPSTSSASSLQAKPFIIERVFLKAERLSEWKNTQNLNMEIALFMNSSPPAHSLSIKYRETLSSEEDAVREWWF